MFSGLATDTQKHSAAHVLAMAVSQLYPDTKIGIGPVTRDGFYYDFDVPHIFSKQDFQEIESQINVILQANLNFQQITLSREQAINLLLQKGQVYKAELVKAINDPDISFFKTGDGFIDLCRGPHVQSTNKIGLVKLTHIEQTYWNEDPTRPAMQRIYGKVFTSFAEYEDFIKYEKELKNIYYGKVARDLRLGFVKNGVLILSTRGTTMLQRILQILKTTSIKNKEAYPSTIFHNEMEVSKFLDEIKEFEFVSYKEYPLTYSCEAVLKSMTISKSLNNIPAYVAKDYFQSPNFLEIYASKIESIIKALKSLNLEPIFEIYARDLDDSITEISSNIFQKNFITHSKIVSEVESTIIVMKFKDKFAREWPLGKMTLSEGYDEQIKQNTTTITTTFMTLEILKCVIENSEGKIPSSISPSQIVCIPVNSSFTSYAEEVAIKIYNATGIQPKVDITSTSLKRKIYRAENQNTKFIVVIGDKEKNTSSVSIREGHSDLGLQDLDDFIATLKRNI